MAVVTFDDGEQVLVQLTGAAGSDPTTGCPLPEVSADAEVVDADGQPRRDRWVQIEEELRLESVRLEIRHGRLVPDVTCEAFGDDGQVRYLPLLVEVTVTNHIDVERLERIRTAGEATLEIDLSLAGGRVNQDELRRLVVDELATKRWLHHPEQTLQSRSLRDRLEKQVASERAERAARDERAAAVRQQVLATPIATIATEYLDAVTQMATSCCGPKRRSSGPGMLGSSGINE
jgi:hypothetical protein